MGLATPESAVLSAVIFNALIIIALIPLAFEESSSGRSEPSLLLRHHVWSTDWEGSLCRSSESS